MNIPGCKFSDSSSILWSRTHNDKMTKNVHNMIHLNLLITHFVINNTVFDISQISDGPQTVIRS